MGKNRPLNFSLSERTFKTGKFAGKTFQVALPTNRHAISFERFCELVAGQTTFNYMEVASVLNLADMARSLVANGDIVEYGRLGRLRPSIKSHMVPQGETFNANTHIKGACVTLMPSRKYFRLADVSFERTATKMKKGKSGNSPSQVPRLAVMPHKVAELGYKSPLT